MNRCITCGKIVTRPKAQNTIERDNHTYLVCCPLCEREFDRAPEHYIAVARSVLGDYALKAHSQKIMRQNGETGLDEVLSRDPDLLRNLQSAFSEIERSFADLYRHFDRVSESAGLDSLPNVLGDHRELMEALQSKMTVHAGVCRFIVSVAESSAKAHTHK